MTNPSIWTPGEAISANSSRKYQWFTAAAGQTVFTLTNFTYAVGTGAIAVTVSGVEQRPGTDFTEISSNAIELTSPVEETGTTVLVEAFVEVTGNPQTIADASTVTYSTGTVKDALDVRLPEFGNYAALNAYVGQLLPGVYVRGVVAVFDGGYGIFRPTSDTPAAANGIYQQDGLGRWWKRDFPGPVDIAWFATGDGVTIETSKVQAAIDAAYAVGELVMRGKEYKTGSLHITQPLKITAYKSKIKATSNIRILNITSSDVHIDGLEIEGVGNSVYDQYGTLIYVYGVTAADTPPAYISNVSIRNCYIHSAGRSGILFSAVSDFVASFNKIEHVGYAGVEVQSGLRGNVDYNVIDDVSPGNGFNAYGIYFSQKNNSDVVAYPTSKQCSARFNKVSNVFWEGLDCHGGEDLTFEGNYLLDCGATNAAIMLAHADGESSVPLSGAKRVKVVNNTIVSTVIGELGHGISCTSAAVTAGYEDQATLSDSIISGNTVIGCGKGSASYAGVNLGYSNNVLVSNNVIKSIYGTGIRLSRVAKNISINNNLFIDVHSSANYGTAIMVLRSAAGPVFVSGNSLLDAGLSATYKNQIGLNTTSDPGGIVVGQNNFGIASYAKYVIPDAQFNDDAAPVVNFGRTTLVTTTSVSSVESTLTLQNPHGSISVYQPFVCLSAATAGITKISLEVTKVSATQIKIIAKTSDGTNFAAGGNINVNWSTMGA